MLLKFLNIAYSYNVGKQIKKNKKKKAGFPALL